MNLQQKAYDLLNQGPFDINFLKKRKNIELCAKIIKTLSVIGGYCDQRLSVSCCYVEENKTTRPPTSHPINFSLQQDCF